MRRLVLVLSVGVICIAFATGCVKPPEGYPTREAPPEPPPVEIAEAEPPPAAEPAPVEIEEGVPEDEITPAPVDEVPSPVTEAAEEPEPAAPPAPADWEGVVGREAPPAEVTQVAPRRPARAAAPARPRPAPARPRPRPAPTPPPDPVWDRITAHEWGAEGRFPWASELELATGVFARFSNKDLSIMAMEILARRGKPFDQPAWRRHFDRQSWYYPQSGYSEASLSAIERGNYKRIRDYQARRFGKPWEAPSDWSR